MRFGQWILVALAGAVVAGGCTSGFSAANKGSGCTPGAQTTCACPGGGQGAQVCLSDGSGYGACVGCGDGGAGASSGGDASGGSGSGGSGSGGSGSGGSGSGGSGSGGSGSGGSSGASSSGASSSGGHADAGACPPGLQCNVPCPAGADTTVTGTVYDPAARNPLYDVVVYVPAGPLPTLPKGVPTGTDACSCAALYKSGAITATRTGVDGKFTLHNVPVGAQVPLVLQTGKWRKVVDVAVTSCTENPQPDQSLHLPATVAAGTADSMPDIAVSTGGADTLECLMTRMGLPTTEYVAGAGTGGHVHVFSGGDPAGGGGATGTQESPPMSGAPSSPQSLWATPDQLMPYDAVLLSCEGGETYAANPPALETYLAAGGRVLASHYHYAWFAGPVETQQSYSAPTDWGANLATWSAPGTQDSSVVGASVVQTLNPSGAPFPRGAAFAAWLQGVGALGQNGVASGELSIFQARYNAVVGTSNPHSQPWLASGSNTMAFSFETPVSAANVCGRALYTDLHVAGDPSAVDTPPPPGGCGTGPLSAQEKALEFMLFDLTSCILPDGVSTGDAGVP